MKNFDGAIKLQTPTDPHPVYDPPLPEPLPNPEPKLAQRTPRID